jgi:hypothetical protein
VKKKEKMGSQKVILDKLKHEAVRLKTFRTWPGEYWFVSVQDMARAGFFYFNQGDAVQCAFCLGIVNQWQPMDGAMGEHRRLFPRCPFVMGLPVGNVPMNPVPPPPPPPPPPHDDDNDSGIDMELNSDDESDDGGFSF